MIDFLIWIGFNHKGQLVGFKLYSQILLFRYIFSNISLIMNMHKFRNSEAKGKVVNEKNKE